MNWERRHRPILVDITSSCPLATVLAARLRDASAELTARWLDRIVARVSLDPNRVFPTDALLDHVPLLVVGIADYLEDPAHEVGSDAPVVGKAMELGDLRHVQGFDVHEIQKEYELLGGILFAFLARSVDEIDLPCERSELLVCAQRLFRAITLIQQATTNQFLQRAAAQVREREERLRAFNRALTHEFKNQIHTAMGATQALALEGVPPDTQRRFVEMADRALHDMQHRLEGLLDLTRMDEDTRQQRHILLQVAAGEAVRSLREHAATRGVAVRLAPALPPVEVHAAAVELCLANYLSNAIKYADPGKPARWAEVHAELRTAPVVPDAPPAHDAPCELVVEVRDNGLGVPEPARASLFNRFVRAHDTTITGIEGTGLGLSIVRETVEALGGRAWAEFPAEGSVFAFALPCRRARDRDAQASGP